MSYELVGIENSRGTYTAARPFQQSFGLTPNDASIMNVIVFVTSITGGAATAAVTMQESYDAGATWQNIAVTVATISAAGAFKTSPNEASIISPLVRLTITPAASVVLVIDNIKRTRIASGPVSPKNPIIFPPGSATEATLAAINTKIPAQGQALASASVPVVLTVAQIATLTPQTNALTDAQLRATAVPVSVAGVATAANQGTTNAALSTLIAQTDGIEGSLVSIDNKSPALVGGRQPVDVGASVLPTGAATETTLAALNTKIPAQGQALATASVPVVLTAVQITTLTPQTNAITDAQIRATALPVSGTVSVTGVATETTLAALNTKTPALGQALAASSSPVVLTAAQITTLTPQTNALTDVQLRATALPVSGTVAVTGVATETTLAAIRTRQDVVDFGATTTAQRVAAAVGNLSGAVSAANPLQVDIGSNNIATPFTAVRQTATTSSGVPAIFTKSMMMGFDFASSTHRELTVDVNGNISAITGFQFAVRIVSATQLPYIVDFSSANLTTSYTQVIASTLQDIKSIQVQNQGSAPVHIAVGSAASEIVQYIALAGHDSAVVPVGILSGSRIAIRSGSGTITSGFFVINAIG